MAPSPVAHFAINADDVDRAKAFYSEVFGWEFTSGGWPEFFHIDTGTEKPGHPVGSLQRRWVIVEGRLIHGFKCTIAVSDLGAVTDAAKAAGGRRPDCHGPLLDSRRGDAHFHRGHGGKHRGSHALRPDHRVLEVASPQKTRGIRRIMRR